MYIPPLIYTIHQPASLNYTVLYLPVTKLASTAIAVTPSIDIQPTQLKKEWAGVNRCNTPMSNIVVMIFFI